MSDMKAMMAKEAERLNDSIRDAEKRRDLIDAEIDDYKREKKALTAYHNALHGKTRTTERAPRGSIKDAILAVIKDNPDGIAPKDIKAQVPSVAGSSIANTLSALKKQKAVGYKDGKYLPA